MMKISKEFVIIIICVVFMVGISSIVYYDNNKNKESAITESYIQCIIRSKTQDPVTCSNSVKSMFNELK